MHIIHTTQAPAAIGPYVQAVRTGNLLYCSGQTPLNPTTMQIEETDVEQQTRVALENLEAILHAAGLALHHVVKTNVYLTDMRDFPGMNAMYEKVFGTHRPARTTVAVAGLPLQARVEIECIAEFANP